MLKRQYQLSLYDHFLTVYLEGDKRQQQSCRRVLLSLLGAVSDGQIRNAGPQRTFCSTGDLCQALKMSRSTVYRSLERLEAQGFIERAYKNWSVNIPQELADQISSW